MGTKESSQDRSRKYLNIKIGERLHEHMLGSSVFQRNWKAISPSFFFLNRSATYNDASDGKPAPFFSRELARIYQPYTGGLYRTYISALSRLDLLDIVEGYELPKRVGGKKVSDGECKRYSVTELGRRLLADGNYIYLRRFHTDKPQIRRNNKDISRRKVMHRTYGDYVLNHICDVHKQLDFRYGDLKRLKEL